MIFLAVSPEGAPPAELHPAALCTRTTNTRYRALVAYTEERRDSAGKTTGHVGRFRVDGRLRSTRLFTSKRDALREAEAQEAAGKRSEWVDPKASAVTLAEYFAVWQAARASRAPRTLEAERERFDSLIAPTFGAMPLRRIDYDAVARWSATMESKRSAAVASQARRRDATRLLVQVLDSAVDGRRLAHNPARTRAGKVPYMPAASKTKPHRYLSHEQLRRVADATASDQARALVLLCGLTGLRWGEVSALTAADVDLLRGRLVVNKAYTRLDSGRLVLGDTKTHANREVPIGPAVRDVVGPVLQGKRKADLLFATTSGEPLRRESFDRNAFAPAVRAAGHAVSALQTLLGFDEPAVSGVYDASTVRAVEDAQRRLGLPATGQCAPETWTALAGEDRQHREGMSQGDKVSRTRQLATLSRLTLSPGAEDFDSLTLHDLRHTAASLAVAGGATVKAVQRLLGHESARLTLDTYAGLFESDLDALGASMSSAFEATSAHYALTGSAQAPAGVSVLGDRSAL